MNIKGLITKNLTFHRRYYKLISIAALIIAAVLTGSLIVGESVRYTLIKRVEERLGSTETIIFPQNSFLDSAIVNHPLFEGQARSALISNGFISDAGRLVPVMVWGIDDSDILSGKAQINTALATELSAKENIVLRLPATGMVPSGSLFVTKNYTTSLRLAFNGIKSVETGGNISLKNEQTIPYNIFVNRSELAAILGTEGKINLILHDKHLSDKNFSGIWNPYISGIKEQNDEITSERIFIPQAVVETICQNNSNANRLFSYLANSIEVAGNSIPYSFVTAVDTYKGQKLAADEVILSSYAASHLKSAVGDTVEITYYTSGDLKTLKIGTFHGRVSKIIALEELAADKGLSADFPGLSNVEKCTDWDSDLPINMDLITKEDEDYWEKYRATPKVILPYQAVGSDWSNSFGSATAIRLPASANMTGLTPDMFGLKIIHPRETAIIAAKSGVDFSSLFLALGFFIIISAILLMLIPLSEMIFRRREEISLLSATGFSNKRIMSLLWKESAPVTIIASIAGSLAGLIYTWFILKLLGTLWKGATQTGGFIVFPHATIIVTGLIISIIISLALLRITISRSLKNIGGNRKIKPLPLRIKLIIALLLSVGSILTVILNLLFIQDASLFVVTGVTLLITITVWGDYLISKRGTSRQSFDVKKLVWSGLYANRKRALLSFVTLSAGVFIVFSVGLNRKGFEDSSQLKTGTGGYSLWCESSVPIYHNINTEYGRERLALSDLPDDAHVLQILRYSADDASCLNLNKVSQPTVLGVDMNEMANSSFMVKNSIYPAETQVFQAVQQAINDTVFPVLVDETVLIWGLMLKLGDTISYENENGQRIWLQLAGTLHNSVFQGSILIDKKLFSQLWSGITGSEIVLMKTQQVDEAKMLMSQALHEYGVRVTTTAQRLSEFNRVTDTYLNIFLTLGGIGLLLGIMSFIIVIRKDLASRKDQISVLRAIGFSDSKIYKVLQTENRIIPLCAVIAGIMSSLAGAAGFFSNIGTGVWLLTIILSVFFVGCIIIFINKSITGCLND